MDPELIAFLQANFEETQNQIRENRALIEDTRDQVQENRALIEDTRDQVRENRGLIRENRGLIEENRTLIEDTRDQVSENRTEIRKNRKQNHGTQVMVENLRSKIEAVAEGHATLDAKIDRRFAEAEAGRARSESVIKAAIGSLSRRGDGFEERFERLETA